MKTLVVSYSLTQNNRLLADHLSKHLDADREDIVTERGMSMFALAMDSLFSRRPNIQPVKKDVSDYDLVVVTGPVWMGKLASPIRSFLARNRAEVNRLAFASVCGGALGRNDKVPVEIAKIAGATPVAVRQLYINDLLPEAQRGDSKATSAYAVTQSDLEKGWKSEVEEFVEQVRAAAAPS